MKNSIKLLFAGLFVTVASVQSCAVKEIPVYSGDPSVYFFRYLKDASGANVRVDTCKMSFSHHYGVSEYTQEYYLGLIGKTPERDLEYKLAVVEDKTTATPDQYSLPEKLIFRKGHVMDTLGVTVYKDKIAEGDEKVLTLRLVDSEDLKVGFSAPDDSYTDIKFRFNNKVSKPLWWKGDIEYVFFGTYSYKKFVTIIEANPGFSTVEGLNSAEIRIIAINTKEYIKEHGITEEDGSEMEFPIY